MRQKGGFSPAWVGKLTDVKLLSWQLAYISSRVFNTVTNVGTFVVQSEENHIRDSVLEILLFTAKQTEYNCERKLPPANAYNAHDSMNKVFEENTTGHSYHNCFFIDVR